MLEKLSIMVRATEPPPEGGRLRVREWVRAVANQKVAVGLNFVQVVEARTNSQGGS